jgi:hypothetical protein
LSGTRRHEAARLEKLRREEERVLRRVIPWVTGVREIAQANSPLNRSRTSSRSALEEQLGLWAPTLAAALAISPWLAESENRPLGNFADWIATDALRRALREVLGIAGTSRIAEGLRDLAASLRMGEHVGGGYHPLLAGSLTILAVDTISDSLEVTKGAQLPRVEGSSSVLGVARSPWGVFASSCSFASATSGSCASSSWRARERLAARTTHRTSSGTGLRSVEASRRLECMICRSSRCAW